MDTTTTFDDALHFAINAHSGQKRKGADTPYIVHPLEVLTLLSAAGASEEVAIAGVLHDVVEDAGVTPHELEMHFGARVAELVQTESEDKSLSWVERKRHTLDTLAEAPRDVKLIALADKLSNMRAIARDFERIGDALWERFNAPKERQGWYYSGIVDALDGMQDDTAAAPLYWELNALVKDVFVDAFYDEKFQAI